MMRRLVMCSKWLMYWSEEPPPVDMLAGPWVEPSRIPGEQSLRLSGEEASTVMELAENGSLPMTPAAASAVEKLRKALAVAGGGPHALLQLTLTDEEAAFLARTRMA